MNQIIEIASIMSAIGTICAFLFGIYKFVKTIENVMKRLDEIDKSQCKNYLVRFLKDKERGVQLSEIEIQRAHEAYEHYTDDLNGNNYIHAWWDKQMGGEK